MTERESFACWEYPKPTPNWDLSMSCSYVLNQGFHIIKIIIITSYTIPVINHSIFLISFKAVQKMIFTISSGKLSKSIRLYFT